MFLVGFSGVTATILYLHAMEKDEASIVAPLFQMIPVFGLILEYFILNIIPSNIQIVGSFIIVIAGIVLATEYEGFKIRRINSLKRDGILLFGINIAGESITTVANSLKNFAALLVPVTLVYSVEALQPIFVFAFGILITLFLPKMSQEDISRKALLMKGIPIIFMIVGTILILH